MSTIINLVRLQELFDKIESNGASKEEHIYFQKLIIAQELFLDNETGLYNKQKEFTIYRGIIKKYYVWLLYNLNSHKIDYQDKIDLYIFKHFLDKSRIVDKFALTQVASNQYDFIYNLASLCDFYLQKNRSSVLKFFHFFLGHIYKIPNDIIENLSEFIQSDWKLSKSTLALTRQNNLDLNQVEHYFLGDQNTFKYEVITNKSLNKTFSVSHSKYENYLFLPKKTELDLIESALIVHELQHILDDNNTSIDNNISTYSSEKRALNSEKIFLTSMGANKHEKRLWIESNLYYPALMLEFEVRMYCQEGSTLPTFTDICQKHQIDPLNLSPLYFEGAPFQMSHYCGASMELESNWKEYLFK